MRGFVLFVVLRSSWPQILAPEPHLICCQQMRWGGWCRASCRDLARKSLPCLSAIPKVTWPPFPPVS